MSLLPNDIWCEGVVFVALQGGTMLSRMGTPNGNNTNIMCTVCSGTILRCEGVVFYLLPLWRVKFRRCGL